ncbi:unnamed protein product [Peronospora belbahrii]|uniref:Soluble Rieske-type ferredoxin domain-containing protein n=1 Tax=Peronospora belbahrii TaxID=622444 RepID=A0ABN8D0N6_9STRA|nr:unnamed protein product [Peronospora belbahrii]
MSNDPLVYEFVCKLEKFFAWIKPAIVCLELGRRDDHGGPLFNGDIEEIDSKMIVKCPWHAYHIVVETGEGIYKGVNMTMTSSGKLQPSSPKLKSKGVKQRTHLVELRNGGQDIYIADSSAIPGASIIESDMYAFRTINIPETAKKGEVQIHSRFE